MNKNRKKLVVVFSLLMILICGSLISCSSSNDKKEAKKKQETVTSETDSNQADFDDVEGAEDRDQEEQDAVSEEKSDQAANTAVNDTTEKKETSAASSDAAKTQTTSASTSKTTSSSSAKTTSKSSHTHNWVAVKKTVHHEATGHNEQYVITEAWDEEVSEPVYEMKAYCICNQCGADITENPSKHLKDSALSGGNCGGWHSEYKQVQTGTNTYTVHHDAVYGTRLVEDTAAYDEKVITGYKCSCGATK